MRDRLAARRSTRKAIVDGRGIRYPDELPITARREELLGAIRSNQLVIVAGETGSGKSTQLPKLCLDLGRGVEGVIGHTQPRRVAARTIAARIAEELGSDVGGAVGFTVRFDDRIADGTVIRVMTDGILLAELQRDRRLSRYDTLIIDEAHERSLNVDFLLGHLHQLLPSRPDLTAIITSATIDTARFAEHFAAAGIATKVVELTGRTYPVDVRYRPIGEEPGDERDQVQAIADAVAELEREGPGDVLVFLSGEREIHDTADALRRRELSDAEVLPLYARLSSAEQRRIFEPHRGRRIVLSTNVAETSLTVPGIRSVVDTGVARISRYSRRLKVQRLPIEPISKASADQRAGRCGRLGPGVCIRLYSDDDYESRPDDTEPEIRRTNLASVILQMMAAGLGDIGTFGFVDPPDAATVRDGYALLEELGAVEGADDAGGRRLTSVGRRLARLPVDPRLGRMVLEAERLGCVREVLVVAAALSIQDPRERPEQHREAAREAHRRFDVAGSDLLALVALWDHLREQQRQLSGNQFRKLCRAEYLNYLRVREWQDLFSQLRRAAGTLGIRPGAHDSHPDHVHRALLAGLLSHVGVRDRDGREFIGARGARFVIARDSSLARRAGRWVMAAELVETNRLWARRVATIQPEWAEQAANHLVKRSYGEPRWHERRGRAVTSETVTLYGLPIVTGRTIGLDRVDPAEAHRMFARHALVDGEWLPSRDHAFLSRNRAFLGEVASWEQRLRRADLLDEERVVAFYERCVPDDVSSTSTFERWWRRAGADQPHQLDLTLDVLRLDDGEIPEPDDFPDRWRHGELELPLTYRFDPGGPLDGVSVHVPLALLGQASDDGFDWLVPGYRRDLVAALVRSLPKELRRQLIPAAETVDAAWRRLDGNGPVDGRFVDALAAALTEVSAASVRPADLDPGSLPPHLRMNVVVADAEGTVVDAGHDLAAIRTRQLAQARAEVARAVPIDERDGIITWDLGSLPEVVESSVTGRPVRGYPALVDRGTSVSLRVLTNPSAQARAMRAGVRRLLLLTSPVTAALRRSLDGAAGLAFAGGGLTIDDVVDDVVAAAVDQMLVSHGLPWDEASFEALRRQVGDRAPRLAAAAMARTVEVIGLAAGVRNRLAGLDGEAVAASAADAGEHLARLVHPGFVLAAGLRRLGDVIRYVRGIDYRLERLVDDVGRDRRRMGEVRPLEHRYASYVAGLSTAVPPEVVALGWQLEELRVGTFAQTLGVSGKGASVTRIDRALHALGA